MSTIQRPVRTSLTSDQAERVGELLQPTLVELVELALTSKQLHWTVTGRRFTSVHEQLDEFVARYRHYGDEVAERLASLGIVPDGRAVRVAGDSLLEPVEAAYLSDEVVIDLTVDRIEAAAHNVRDRIPQAAELDPVSEDLLIELLRELELQLWMLSVQQ